MCSLGVSPASLSHGRLCAAARAFPAGRGHGGCSPRCWELQCRPSFSSRQEPLPNRFHPLAGSDTGAGQGFISCHLCFTTQPWNKWPPSHIQQGKQCQDQVWKALSEHCHTEHVTSGEHLVCKYITAHKTNQGFPSPRRNVSLIQHLPQ